MAERESYYYQYWPSGLQHEAVAYIRGGHPGYRLEEGVPLEDWLVPHFDVGGFDESTGQRTGEGTLTNVVNNSVGWLIVDRRTRGLLTGAGIGPRQIQWLDVCLHYQGQEIVNEYFAANILDVRSAVHPAKSRFLGAKRVLTRIVLLQKAIEGADVFRLREAPGHVYFSARLKDVLDRASVTGVEWNPELVAD